MLPDGIKLESTHLESSVRLGLQGEWNAIRYGDVFYRRGVDGVVHISRNEVSAAQLSAEELHESILELCRYALQSDAIEAGDTSAQILERSLVLSGDFYGRQANAYIELYPEGVPVLPPDRYRDVVFPVSTGCPNGQCGFCAFYREKPFSLIKGVSQNNQAALLRKLFPAGVAGREGIFLGSANALALPFATLSEALGSATFALGVPARGIACFGDADHMGARTIEQWQVLRDKGLKHVVLGLETGSAALRKQIGKSDQLWKTVRLAAQLKQANISVGFTVLTGFINPQDFSVHKKETTKFLQGLELQEEDRVYISPWFADDAAEPEERALEEARDMKESVSAQISARVTAYSSHNFYYFS